jgi:hypothetical protein
MWWPVLLIPIAFGQLVAVGLYAVHRERRAAAIQNLGKDVGENQMSEWKGTAHARALAKEAREAGLYLDSPWQVVYADQLAAACDEIDNHKQDNIDDAKANDDLRAQRNEAMAQLAIARAAFLNIKTAGPMPIFDYAEFCKQTATQALEKIKG